MPMRLRGRHAIPHLHTHLRNQGWALGSSAPGGAAHCRRRVRLHGGVRVARRLAWRRGGLHPFTADTAVPLECRVQEGRNCPSNSDANMASSLALHGVRF
jgi:hypothetical protein